MKPSKIAENQRKSKKIDNNFGLYEISVILFFYIMPIISILTEYLLNGTLIYESAIKWVVFWGIGMRLFTCGFKQALHPAFTAKTIFEIKDVKAYPIVRELGFANIATGLCGIISLFQPQFRNAIWFVGFTYYILALLQHVIRKGKNKTEWFATITDLSIVLELLISGLLYNRL